MIKKNDFIEIEFTGRISENKEVFDTNIEKDAKEAKLDIKNLKPFAVAVGQKMLPSGFDDDLIGKEVGKSYTVKLKPEVAFGKRNPSMVRMIPTKLFYAQNINPVRGMQLALDGQLVRVLSNSGGRTLIDFNNPLAGKDVEYSYKILGELKGDDEKINAMQEFLFRKQFPFTKKDKTVTFEVYKEFEPFVKMFSSKFEEITGFKVEAKIVEKPKKEKESKEHVHGPDCDHDHEH